jgi:hypothetical protein
VLTLAQGSLENGGSGASSAWGPVCFSLSVWGWGWKELSVDLVPSGPPQLKKRALGLVRPKPAGGPTGDSPEQLSPEPCSG